MAVVATLSNHFKYLVNTKAIDFDNDTFVIILMNTTFAFNKDTHALLADVTADQLATGNGYTQNIKSLGACTTAENDTDDRFDASWAAVTWTASGGSIGPSGAAIILDTTAANSPVVGCIDFGVDVTAIDGTDFEISSIAYRMT